MRVSFKHRNHVFSCNHGPNICQIVCLLCVNQPSGILDERMHAWVDFEHTALGAVFWNQHVVSLVILDQVFTSWYNQRISFIVTREVGINSAKFFLGFDIRLKLFMRPVQWPISCHYKEKMPEVAREIFFDESLCKLMVKTSPYSNVNIFFLFFEKVVQKLFSSLPVTHLILVVQNRIMESNGFGNWGSEHAWLVVTDVKHSVGQLKDEEQFLWLEVHMTFWVFIQWSWFNILWALIRLTTI